MERGGGKRGQQRYERLKSKKMGAGLGEQSGEGGQGGVEGDLNFDREGL